MLSGLFMRMYKSWIEFLAWIILIGGSFAGITIWKDLGFLGLMLGLLVGFFVGAITLPPLLILFEIHDRLDEIAARK